MGPTHLNTFCRKLISARVFFMTPVVFAFLRLGGLFLCGLPAVAQASPPPEATVKQVADDVYFFFDFSGSNSVFLVTEEGVLVIDTRTHPHEGRDLLDRIRSVTDKPIKWVINSQAVGATLSAWLWDNSAVMDPVSAPCPQTPWDMKTGPARDRGLWRYVGSRYGGWGDPPPSGQRL